MWANARVLLPGGLAAACQLGGDRLGPHVGELADLAVVVGPAGRAGPCSSGSGPGLAAVPGTWADELIGVAGVSGASSTATTRGAHDGQG